MEATLTQNTPNSAQAGQQEESAFRKWAPLFVMALALAIIIIDTTVLNVSLRNIITDFKTDIHKIQWVVTSYSLILAAFTITGGRLGDLYGRKRMFIIGAVIFAIGSIVTALSNGVTMILIGNAIIEGIGACLMMPATAALLITTYHGRDRSVAFGVWGGIIAASAAIGPILGGWLTKNWSWRWAFGINPIVVVILLAGTILIKEAYETKNRPNIDFGGVILSSLGLLSLAFGFIQASVFGWFKAKDQLLLFGHKLDLGNFSVTPLFILLGIVILAVFIWYEKRVTASGKTPLISLGIFKNKPFVIGVLVTTILTLGQTGMFFSIPVFLQAVRNLDPLQTGLTMLPMPLAILFAAPLSSKINTFISPKKLIQFGLLVSIVGIGVLYSVLKVDVTSWGMAPGFAIFGFGMGLIFAQVGNITLSAVPIKEAGEASGINNTARQIGATLGAAIMGAILLSTLSTNLVEGIKNSNVIPDSAKASISESVSENASQVEFGSTSEISNGRSIPEAILNEIKTISAHATTDSNKLVLVYGGVFLLLALGMSVLLPKHAGEHAAPMKAVTSIASDNAPVSASGKIAVTEPAVLGETKPLERLPKSALLAAIVMLVLGAVAGYAIVESGKDNKDSENQAENVEIVQTNDVPLNSETQNGDNSSNESMKPNTPTPETPQTTEPLADNSNKIYSSDKMHMEFSLPSDWRYEEENNEVVVKASDSRQYSLQMYEAPNGDPESFKEFLIDQSNLHNITDSTVGSFTGYQFNVDGYYKHGFAILNSNRIYYFLGTGIENTELLRTFKVK